MKKHISLLASAAMALMFAFTACNSSDDNNPAKAERVFLNKTTLTLLVGDSEKLSAIVRPNGADQGISWESSNQLIATVANDGTVAGVALGAAIITVTSNDGGYKATCNVTVSGSVVIELEGGALHTLAIRNGELWGWDYNADGQLGVGDYENRYEPTRVGNETDWKAVSCGDYHTMVLKANGTLWGMGYNGANEGISVIGDGMTEASYIPTQIGDETNWKAVSAGGYHNLALKINGSLWAWGHNDEGQCGNSSFDGCNTPTQIGNETNWVAVFAGGYHSMALKTDGSLWAWGHNGNGELGLGDYDNRNAPTRVGNETDWKTISVGAEHTIALKNNGTLWVWGSNGIGDWFGFGVLGLGINEETNRNIPTQIGNETDWKAVSAGDYHTLALKTDGSLYAWGNNEDDMLGIDTGGATRTAPARVGNETNWEAVFAGGYYSMALKNNDSGIYAWGYVMEEANFNQRRIVIPAQ